MLRYSCNVQELVSCGQCQTGRNSQLEVFSNWLSLFMLCKEDSQARNARGMMANHLLSCLKLLEVGWQNSIHRQLTLQWYNAFLPRFQVCNSFIPKIHWMRVYHVQGKNSRSDTLVHYIIRCSCFDRRCYDSLPSPKTKIWSSTLNPCLPGMEVSFLLQWYIYQLGYQFWSSWHFLAPHFWSNKHFKDGHRYWRHNMSILFSWNVLLWGDLSNKMRNEPSGECTSLECDKWGFDVHLHVGLYQRVLLVEQWIVH